MAEFVVEGWFVIKLEVCALFAARKNGGRRNGEGGEREESHLSGHKLITNEFIDEFKFIDNFVYKNNTSLYFLTSFFHSFFSHFNSLSIYQFHRCLYYLYYSLTPPLKWKPFRLETYTDSHYLVLNFYQINGDGEIRTRDRLVIKTLIPGQRTISTQ